MRAQEGGEARTPYSETKVGGKTGGKTPDTKKELVTNRR